MSSLTCDVLSRSILRIKTRRIRENATILYKQS